MMVALAKALVGLAALAFVLAIVTNFRGEGLLTSAEGWSRATNNLTLLALALLWVWREGAGRPQP